MRNGPGWIGVAIAVVAVGCGDDAGRDAPPPPVDASSSVDAGRDAGVVEDAGAEPDARVATDTWGSFTMGFFDTYCVECHAGAPSGRDYRTIDDVMRDATIIRCGVAPATEPQTGCGASPAAGQFPVGEGPFPSDAERRRLVAWIDAGLPE